MHRSRRIEQISGSRQKPDRIRRRARTILLQSIRTRAIASCLPAGLRPAKGLKDLARVVPGHNPGQVSHTEIYSVPFPSCRIVVLGGHAKQRQWNREMGLERSRIPVAHDRASRLHPAIILSSEQHATNQDHNTRRCTHKFFRFIAQSISNASAAERTTEKAETNRLFTKPRDPVRV